MTYNIHPLFVHFPIALLFIYSIIKVLPLEKWFANVSWKHIERALLVFGTLGAFAAMTTGEIAENISRPNHQLVEMHSTFATASTWIYAILLVGEILAITLPLLQNFLFKIPAVNKFLLFVHKLITDEVFSATLAFLGLVAISITGLLGGVMVYGTSADPVAGLVLKILGIDF